MKATTIEVCQGPDCKGIGGGAALLEIEELVQNIPSHHEHEHPIHVQPGGCRNFCSMGPNVHILQRKIMKESFHQVKNVDMCKDILQTIQKSTDSSCTGTSPIKNIHILLQKRANQKRWEMLKQISLILSKCHKEISQLENEKDVDSKHRKGRLIKRRKQDCQELIWNIYQMEISVSSRDSIVVDAAKRRFENLNALMDLKFNALMNRNDSDDEVEDDSSSDDSC